MSSPTYPITGVPPMGQPAQMQDGEFTPAAPRPRLFGQGQRELAGTPKIIVVPNPAVGHDWTYAFSGPSWYYLRFGLATLTTSAVVANRGVALVVSYTGIRIGGFNAAAVQAASNTFPYSIGAIYSTSTAGGFVGLPCPDTVILKDGMTVGTNTVLIDVADQWSAIALYVEEFTDKCLDYL